MKILKIAVLAFFIAGTTYIATPRAEAFMDTLNAGLQAIGHAIQKVQSALHMGADVAGHGATTTSVGINTAADAAGKAAQSVIQATTTNGDPAGAANKATTVAHQASDAPCIGIEKAEEIAATADTGVINSFAIVSGSAGEVAKLQARILALTAVLRCREFQKAAIASGTPEFANSLADKVGAKLQELTTEIESLKNRISRLRELSNASAKDFLMTLLTKVGLRFQQEATNRVVNGFIRDNGIDSYIQKADAFTNQINVIDQINKNFDGDVADSLMVQSIATNRLVAPQLNKLRNAYASNKAMQYAGADCLTGAALNDPNFYRAMAKCGSTEADPLYQGMVLGQQSQQVRSAAAQATDQMLENSKGFIPSMDCKGSIAVQKQMESNFEQATLQAEVDQKVYVKAKEQYQAVTSTRDQAKIAEAKAVLDDAKARWTASMDKLDSLPAANGNEKLQTICKIVASGSHAADTINGFVEAQLNKQLDIDTHSIGGIMGRIADTAANLLVNVAFGNGASVTQTLKELGLQGLGLGTQAIMQGISDSRNNANSNANGGLGGTPPFTPTDSCPVPGTCGGGGNTGFNGKPGSVAGSSIFQIRGPAPSIR